MCYWGVAFALGPEHQRADHRGRREGGVAGDRAGARRWRPARPRQERAYIEALAKRYTADPTAERAPLDRAYADAMRDVVKTLPRRSRRRDALRAVADGHVAVELLGQGRQPARVHQRRARLARVGAEAEAGSPRRDPPLHPRRRGVARSRTRGAVRRQAAALAPGAGHLVHMPAHIYLRTGRYNDASVANENAIKADEAYFARAIAVAGNMTYQVGYYPHNFHFFVDVGVDGGTAGRCAESGRRGARADARRTCCAIPAMGGMVQHMHLTPLYTKVRFGMWDDGARRAGAARRSAVHDGDVAHRARSGVRRAGARWTRPRPNGPRSRALKDDPSLKTLDVSSVNSGVVDRRDRARRAVGRDRQRKRSAPTRRRAISRRPWRSRTGSPTWSRPTGRFRCASCRAPRCSSSDARRTPRRRFAAT